MSEHFADEEIYELLLMQTLRLRLQALLEDATAYQLIVLADLFRIVGLQPPMMEEEQ